MRLGLALATFLGFSSLIAARDGRRGKGNDNGNDSDDHPSSSTSAASSTVTGTTASGATSSPNSTSVATTGTVCETYMCVSGTINGSTTTYVMQSMGKADLGWMAIGFGSTMANTPMVIMWPNSDGSITLSQRQASGEVMPTLVSSPPRVASADQSDSDLTGTQPKLTFTIETSGGTSQKLIWAFGTTNPGSSAQDANLLQHLDSGATTLDMSTSSSGTSTDPASNPNAQTGSDSAPLLRYQKMIIAHALLCTIGFLILLPAGALLARYTRTFSNAWFKGHWVFQIGIAGPVITAGVILGIDAVAVQGAAQVADTHKKLGIALWVIYFCQCALGYAIHRWKPWSWTFGKKRPAQNYGHAIIGILIVAISFYEVRLGFHHEWDVFSARPPIGKGADIVWYIWVVLIPVAYMVGLAFLPKQYRQERPIIKESQSEFPLQESYTDEVPHTSRY